MTDAVQQQAGREAAEWHARLQSRSVSNEELDLFYEWRASPANAAAFEAVDAMWSRAELVAGDPRIRSAVEEVGREIRGRRSFLGVDWRFWGIGAMACAALLLALAVTFPRPGSYRTGVGETLVVRLEDGSRVTLNTSTRLLVRLSAAHREVELLEGQALFQVAHDPARPFRVAAGGTSVTAIGTEFEVRRGDRGVSVLLVQGRISVEPGRAARAATLSRAGDTLAATGMRVDLGRSDPAVALSWRDSKIDMRDLPLSAAIAEVNRYSSRPVVLDSPDLATSRVSGVFATGDREAFAAAVTALLSIRQERDADGTIHLRKPDGR